MAPNFKDKDMKTLGIKVKKKISKSNLIKRCDVEFSKRIRERDGMCLKCGKRTGLQCAHLVSRTYRHLRWDPQNAITLCYACHLFWAHKSPLEFSMWLQKLIPKSCRYILREKYKDLAPPTEEEVQEILTNLKAKKLDGIRK